MSRPTSLRSRAPARGRAKSTAGFDWNPVMIVEPTIMPTSVPGAYDRNVGLAAAADSDARPGAYAEPTEPTLRHLERVPVGARRRVRLAVRPVRTRGHVGGGHESSGAVEPGDRQRHRRV